MRKRNRFLIGFLLFVILSMGSCKILLPSGSWNYKITVNVETPEGIKSGSAVRKIKFYSQPVLLPNLNPILHKTKGEAVVVDLGARGQVFGLISWGSFDEFYSAFPLSPEEAERSRKGTFYRLRHLWHYKSLKNHQSRPLPLSDYPRLVYFKDLKDPKTVDILYETACNEREISYINSKY